MKFNSPLFLLFTFAFSLFAVVGCATVTETRYGAVHPVVEVENGRCKFAGEYVKPAEVPKLLEKRGIAKDRVIHVRVDELDDLAPHRQFLAFLALNGYTRAILVTERHAESRALDGKESRERRGAANGGGAKPKIRYKKANE